MKKEPSIVAVATTVSPFLPITTDIVDNNYEDGPDDGNEEEDYPEEIKDPHDENSYSSNNFQQS